MRRGIIGLAAVLIVGTVAAFTAFFIFHRPQPAPDWLQRRFALTEDQFRRVDAMNREYAATCTEMCNRIRESDARLADLLAASDRVTPEIRNALAETDRVRTDCRTHMLAHFYEVAAVMPAEKRRQYLTMVYPLIQDPEVMRANQVDADGR